MPSITGRSAGLAFALAALLAATGCSGLRASLNERALHPRADYELWPEDLGLAAEDVFVPVDGLRLHGWLVPAREAKGIVVVFHGNYPNAAPYLLWAEALHAAGFHALLVSYRGFGPSEGEPDCWSLGRDGEAIVRWVGSRPELARLPLGVLGVSLGTLPALATAVACPEVRAVVLDSPFLPRLKIEQALGGFLGAVGPALLLPESLDSVALAARLERPLLVIHGAHDRIAEPAGAVELFRRARGPRFLWLAPDAGHAPGVAGFHEGAYGRQLARFLGAYLAGESGRPLVEAVATKSPGESGFRARLRAVAGVVGEQDTWGVELCAAARGPDGRVVLAWRRDLVHPDEAVPLPPLEGELLAVGAVLMDDEDGFVHTPAGRLDWRLTDEARAQRAFAAYGEAGDVLTAASNLALLAAPRVAAGLVPRLAALAAEREKKGDRAGARNLLERALELVPEDLCRVLGDAHWELRLDPAGVAAIHRRLAALLDPGETAAREEHARAAQALDERARVDAARQAARTAEVLRKRALAPRE